MELRESGYDLSRMEADDILMNISEIESLNYKYVELDLLNLPRDLSTNLNEDSDNPIFNFSRRLTSIGTFPCDCRNV
jgi:hypothetical protein